MAHTTKRRPDHVPRRGVALISAALIALTGTALPATASAATPTTTDIVVDGTDVAAAAKSRNGLTFKGFGALSGNATSSLLMDYKSQHPQQYWTMIRVLFGGSHPLLNTVKVEMGNDRNTSTGPEPAVMRTADEYPDVAREPGFQLAADALKVNPDVKVSILRWKYPAWVGGDNQHDNIYKWYKNTILAVYREYGYMVDSVNPHINESKPDYSWTEDFAHRIKTDETGFIGAAGLKDLHGNAVPAWSSSTEKRLFHKIRVVISDEVGLASFGPDIIKDKKLRDAVDIAGYHYNTADDKDRDFTQLAEKYDKEVWNSEAQATFSVTADRPANTMSTASGEGAGTNNGKNDGTSGTGIGGINSALEMANTAVRGFVASRRTNFIYQPAISAFYDGYQYSSKELMSMHDPWSGYVSWDGALAVLEQFSRFAKTGYENDSGSTTAKGIWRAIPQASRSDISDGNPPGRGTGSSSSRSGADSYMTLAAPDKSAFSTVIVNDSAVTKTYRIKTSGMSLPQGAQFEQWSTQAAGPGETYNARYMRPVSQTKPDAQGWHTVTVQPWSISTVTSLDDAVEKNGTLQARPGEGSQIPTTDEYAGTGAQAVLDTDAGGDRNGVTGDTTLYADNFEYAGKKVTSFKKGHDVTEDYLASRGGDTGATPRYTVDTNGAFEVVRQADGTHILRQQVGPGMDAGAWNGGDPRTTIGDSRWANYTVSVDARFEKDSGYALVGARQWGNSSNGVDDSVAQLKVDHTGSWTFSRYGTVLAKGTAAGFKPAGQWNRLSVSVDGAVYTARINGTQVASYTDPQPQATGRIQLGSSFDFVDFDNLAVTTVPGSLPYATDLIDNMHQRSWKDGSPVLRFNQKWQHLDGQGMFVYKRSVSTSTGAGASLSLDFDGTGVDLLGTGDGSAALDVSVDGTQVASGAKTTASSNTQPTFYRLDGLKAGHHTVTLTTANDRPVSLDAVSVIGTQKVDSTKADTARLKKDVDQYATLTEGDFNKAGWAVFSADLAQARTALADPSAWGLDTVGAASLADRLEQARADLVPSDVSTKVLDLGVSLAVIKGAALPSTVTIGGGQVPVTWNTDATKAVDGADDYSLVTLSGTTTARIADPDGGTAQKLRYRFTAKAEVLPTSQIAYFIDTGANPSDAPEYDAVRKAVPSLKNKVPDQLSSQGSWGHGAGQKTHGTSSDGKFDTGDYATGATQTYTLPLEAGTYRLTTGFQEWWGGQNRSMNQSVSWQEGGQTKTVAGPAIPALQQGRDTTSSMEFTLTKAATVTYTLTKAADHDPICSWLAVARVPRSLGTIAVVKGGSLPSSVAGQKVDWSTPAQTLSSTNLFDDVIVRGTVAGQSGTEEVTARAEIIPAGLRYYIDSGTGGKASPQYSAVKAAVPDLLNAVSDQASDGTSWGYAAAGANVKGGTDLDDKFDTGLWQKGDTLSYSLPLPAGTYTLTAGFKEWWNTDRSMHVIVSDASGTELARSTVPLSGSSTPLTDTVTIRLKAPTTVRYTVTSSGAGAADPVISWLAAARAAKPDTSALDKALAAAAGLSQQDYTPESWKALASAVSAAKAVKADPSATQQDVDAALAALTKAQSALVRVTPSQPDQPDKPEEPGDSGHSGSTGNPGTAGHSGTAAGQSSAGSRQTSRASAGKKRRARERGGLVDTGVDTAVIGTAALLTLLVGAAVLLLRRRRA